MRGAAQDLRAMATAKRLFGKDRGALHCPVLERQLHRSAHGRLEQLEARESLVEEIAQARQTVGLCRLESAYRTQALLDDRGNQSAPAGKVSISRRA